VLVLAVDTATPAVTAAVVDLDSGRLVSARVSVDARRHGELLGPALREVLLEAAAGPAARSTRVAAVVAGQGPGPFTGLRVGLVTAAAFADAAGIPLYGVCSLDAIAGGAAPLTEPLLVATDARRREVYWAAYRAGVRRHGPSVSRPATLAQRLTALGVGAMAGAGAALYADVLGLPLRDPAYPDPAALVALAALRIRAGAPSEPPVPLYLRRPDAELPRPTKPVLQG
jgi:tRNA threonylcarbamoyl adenosine modification protein YeaZ